MGVTSSKFRQALQRGEEAVAVDLYIRNPNLKKTLKLNRSFGSNHGHNTALHYVTTHAMKELLRDLLSEGANPFVKNTNGQTAFHCVCVAKNGDDERRLECLDLLISWMIENKEVLSSICHVVDKGNNSPLHYAANSGLLQCVKLLVTNGAPLYLENENGQTACDIAMKKNFKDIAEFLESKMVFNGTPESDDEIILPAEDKCGLGIKEIQETKDKLLVQTADMLQISLFMTEGLLRYFEWSRERLLDAWIQDPITACENAGVTQSQEAETNAEHGEINQDSENIDCKICCEVFNAEKSSLFVPCRHKFCTQCWERYLSVKIIDGDINNIKCPSFGCSCLVPVILIVSTLYCLCTSDSESLYLMKGSARNEAIESVVPKDIAQKYGVFNIKAFVDSNPNLKWCPFPHCDNAVRPPETQTNEQCQGAEAVSETSPLIVDCGNEHYFCWNCMQEAHEPSTCEGWQRWLDVIKDTLPKFPKEDLKECPETENVANSLWLITNSKPCPKCSSPIQKNEGCNHIKCTKCKHEFCWVCLEPWKKHNSSTGGYFRCNRYEVAKGVQEKVEEKAHGINEEHEKVEKLNHFLHYYSRFKNHENSYKLEEPLLKSAKDKMVALAIAAESAQSSSLSSSPSSSSQPDTNFVEDVIRKLLKARRVLRASYGYGFFLGKNQEKKIIFESMQTELEEATENLSQMVARPYLRTPRTRIISAAQLTHRKRADFLLALSRGLIPPDSSRYHSSKRHNTGSSEDSEDEFFFEEERTLKLQRLIETSLKLNQGAASSSETGHHRRRRQEHTYAYSSDEHEDHDEDIAPRRVAPRRIIIAQETANLQKAIELSYKDMLGSAKGLVSEPSNDDDNEDIDLKMAIELFMKEQSNSKGNI